MSTGTPSLDRDSYIAITGTSTLTSASGNVVLATLAGAAVLNLPAISTVPKGYWLWIKRTDATVANLTCTPNGDDTINGGATLNIPASQGLRIIAQSATSNWQAVFGPA